MPPKGGNAKKETGRAKKAENEAKKADAAAAERVSDFIRSVAKLNRDTRSARRLLHGRTTTPRAARPRSRRRKRSDKLI
jgi:hypothetical protein